MSGWTQDKQNSKKKKKIRSRKFLKQIEIQEEKIFEGWIRNKVLNEYDNMDISVQQEIQKLWNLNENCYIVVKRNNNTKEKPIVCHNIILHEVLLIYLNLV